MKISFLSYQPVRKLLLTGVVLLAALHLYAQEAEARISIRLKEATLKEFIKSVEKNSDYSFIYSEEVKITRKITLKVDNQPLEEVLRRVFENEPVTYKLSGKHILLQKAPPKPKTKTSSRKYTISGYLTDGESVETLIGAHVFEDIRRQGTTTNPYGFYTLTLPEGEVSIGFSYLGYAQQARRFVLQKDTVLNVQLFSDNRLEEVVITSDRVEAGLMATHTGAVDIPMAHIQHTPVILGEADVMKAIQMMPGVQSGVEGSAGLYVRGGSPDQNLILLDGIPIYNVDHMLGFFSVFSPEAVKKVTLFKSSFPARFGGRLSSVVDVRTNDGDMKNFHGMFSIGLLTSKLNVEGPIRKDRTSFHLSMRRTYLDWLARPFMDKNDRGGYFFYDVNAKVNHKFSDKNRLFLSMYSGKDKIDVYYKDKWENEEVKSIDKESMDVKWGNTVVAARWNNIVSNKLFSNTTLAYNQYRMNSDNRSMVRSGQDENAFRAHYKSGIRDGVLLVDFDYTPTPKHHIKFGGSYIYHDFKPEVMTSKEVTTNGEEQEEKTYRSRTNSNLHANEFSLYAEDNFDIGSRLRTNLGFHLSAFHVQGKSFFSLQPRLSARYQLTEEITLKGSYSKMNQYIHLLTSAPISLPTDLWVPVTKNLKPMLSHQYTLGTYYTGIPKWEFSVEGYYKQMQNVLEYKDGARFIGSSASWEEKVEMGKGRSFGVEMMAQRTVGNTTGWLSYTWAKSDRKFAKGGINNGERFPFKYDRRHQLNVVVNHKFSDRIDVSASWMYATGTTLTVEEGMVGTLRPYYPYYTYDPEYIMNPGMWQHGYVEKRNNYRLPASHRLNIGANFHKKTKRGMRTWNVSVYNVYNAMNPNLAHRGYRTYKNADGTEEEVPVIKKLTIFPFLPSVSYTYRF